MLTNIKNGNQEKISEETHTKRTVITLDRSSVKAFESAYTRNSYQATLDLSWQKQGITNVVMCRLARDLYMLIKTSFQYC